MSEQPLNRAEEVSDLLLAVKALVDPYIAAADKDAATKSLGHGIAVDGGGPRTALVEQHPPAKLASILNLDLPQEGQGKDVVLTLVEKILKYSVNTWDQGFMDKLYSTTNAVGVVSEYLLAVLNTNVHVYQVSPVLTLIEKHTTRALAELVGFEDAPHCGGISQPGGSASNSLSILVARNTKFPSTKTDGYGNLKLTLFTSEHGHYSVEKAAQMFGFGSNAVISVPVDEEGRMIPAELSRLVKESKKRGETPFYVNATAGTTVLGSFDPLEELAKACKEEDLWLHVDGSYGGPIIFSPKLRKDRLRGVEQVDSYTITPHKMLGVPITSSFLVGRDVRQFFAANAIEAEYLFHQNNKDTEVYDLGHFTPQCGRKGDALKLFLGWNFYGTDGYARQIEHAYDMATYLFEVLEKSENFVLVSKLPLPCLQVCFHYARGGKLNENPEVNSRMTERIAQRLIPRGWMIDYAPGKNGKFFRVVVGREVLKGTIEGLVRGIEQVAEDVSGI